MEPVCIVTYKSSSELESSLDRIVESGADAIVCVPAAVEDVIPVQNYVDNFMYTSESGRGIILMFTDKAYNKAILNEDKSVDFISGLAPSSHPSSGFSVSYEHCMIVFRMLARQRCMMRC